MTTYELLSISSNVAYTFTTIFLLIVAVAQLRNTRRDAAIRTAMTVMEGETYAPQRAVFLRVVQSHTPEELGKLALTPKRHPKEIAALRAVANRYEYIATAIKSSALDYRTYKKLWRGSTIKDWERLQYFIQTERKQFQNFAFWVEFQWLVERLTKDKPE